MAYRGLTFTRQTTNLYTNALTPVTSQDIPVTIGDTYSVSSYGNMGYFTLSGAATGIVKMGTPVTFQAATSTLTVTKTNWPLYCMVQKDAVATPMFIASDDTARSKGPDNFAISGLQAKGLIGATSGTLILDFNYLVSVASGSHYVGFSVAGQSNTQNGIGILTSTVGAGYIRYIIYNNSTATSRALGAASDIGGGGKMVLTWDAAECKCFLKGGSLIDIVPGAVVPPANLDDLQISGAGSVFVLRGVKMLNRKLTDAEATQESI